MAERPFIEEIVSFNEFWDRLVAVLPKRYRYRVRDKQLAFAAWLVRGMDEPMDDVTFELTIQMAAGMMRTMNKTTSEVVSPPR